LYYLYDETVPIVSIQINRLEIHATHACNMTCESCSHFSNNHHSGFIDAATAIEWSRNWNERIQPWRVCVLGGEPTLNPKLPEILEAMAACWPNSTVELYTNGWFLHRFPELGKTLGRLKAVVSLSIHHGGAEYAQAISENLQLLKGWEKDHGVGLTISKSWDSWTRRHHGVGAQVMPFTDGNQRASWENCRARYCKQLFEGKIWKCSPQAYFQVHTRKFNIDREAWRLFIEHKPLSPGCSEAELKDFFSVEDEPVCSLCPANPERFDKPLPVKIPLQFLDFSDGDVALLKQILADQAKDIPYVNCLEWGSGASTVELPKHLRSIGKEFSYFSMEHHPEWFATVNRELADAGLSDSVHVRLEHCSGDPFKETMDDYVTFPLKLHKRFNFILIDGRKRRRCLLVASKLLAPGGVVVLHDAQRRHYQCAFDAYSRHERVGDKLWIGKIDL
jgi:hypothetical protein